MAVPTTTESADILRAWMPKGSTVYTILRSVSRSGMQRVIGVVTIQPGPDGPVIRHPNYHVAQVLGRKDVRDQDGVKVSGAGMDMGFELVYSLAQALYADGYALNHRWI